MKLQSNEKEKQMLQNLSQTGEGAVLRSFLERMVNELTNTRNIKGEDMAIEVRAANRAAEMIEENLLYPLSGVERHRPEVTRFD